MSLPSAFHPPSHEASVNLPQVTFDELCNFFRLVGSEMSDDDFSLIVEEMIDSASSKSLIKTLQAQGQ